MEILRDSATYQPARLFTGVPIDYRIPIRATGFVRRAIEWKNTTDKGSKQNLLFINSFDNNWKVHKNKRYADIRYQLNFSKYEGRFISLKFVFSPDF